MKEDVELTVLIPCLNEEKTIGICIDKINKLFNDYKITGEILVVDNNSIDNSSKIAKSKGARVIFLKEKGYGNALKYGFLNANGEYIIFADADNSYNFSEIYPFIESLRNNYDFVIGNRYGGKIEKGAMPFSHRYIGTPIISFLGNFLYKANIKDYNCGLRGIKRQVANEIKLESSGMEFASEMIIKIVKGKYKINQIPINLYKDGRNAKSHLNTIRDGFRHVKILIKGVK